MSTFGIAVGGGPAPGINGVIGAAATRARRLGHRVIGLMDGFSHLMEGDTSRTKELTEEEVATIHLRGGSILHTSRANPTKKPEHLAAVVKALHSLGIDHLITIGGDDTASSSSRVAEAADGSIKVVHVPKTIDNDLPLPEGVPTFGFETAREHGTAVVERLLNDMETTNRWFFVVMMGRSAGHLALGAGKAAGAPITLIPEEFPNAPIAIDDVVRTLEGAIVKRLAHGYPDGVAVLAEGLIEKIDPADLQDLPSVERDAHGHLRLSEVSFGAMIKRCVREELAGLGIPCTIVAKDIGYELRCSDPIPFDIEYTRDLGHCAAHFLLAGHGGALISIQDGRFVPIEFGSIVDQATGRMRVRMVDVRSESYAIARRYMIRLTGEDFADDDSLGPLAAAANLAPDAFRRRFEPLVRADAWQALRAR